MPDRLLHDIGTALHGRRWQSDLARDLGVSRDAVRKWETGERNPDLPRYAARLRELLLERKTAIEGLLKRLP